MELGSVCILCGCLSQPQQPPVHRCTSGVAMWDAWYMSTFGYSHVFTPCIELAKAYQQHMVPS